MDDGGVIARDAALHEELPVGRVLAPPRRTLVSPISPSRSAIILPPPPPLLSPPPLRTMVRTEIARKRHNVLGTHDEEIARLGLQHRVWRPTVLECWQRAGIGRGNRVIDVGAGPGFATLDLAEIVGPTGEVLAAERSSRFLEIATKSLRRSRIIECPLPQHGPDERIIGRQRISTPPGVAGSRVSFRPGHAGAADCRCVAPGRHRGLSRVFQLRHLSSSRPAARRWKASRGKSRRAGARPAASRTSGSTCRCYCLPRVFASAMCVTMCSPSRHGMRCGNGRRALSASI